MIEVRGFNGKLNLDDNPYRLPNGDYSDALNITRDAEGKGQDEVVSNVAGNTEVPYTFEIDTINKVIGNYADKVRNRQYNFVWNSDGYDEITYYDATANTIVKVIKNLTDTGGDNVLNFNIDYKINHIDIIYRDEEGDLLYWTDGLNPPRKINVKTATTGGYGTIISSYLDVAKEPPSAPPYCAYENDNTITVNNLNNKQFKFKYRFVFDDLEKSVTSSQSEVPIPYNYTDQTLVQNPANNSRIRLVLQTGPENVTRIEILGAESFGATWSDFFLISVINKADLNLSSNDVFSYLFYNNEAYSQISIVESIQPFDLVPQQAYTQSLPNGNVLDYGAITEGYDLIIPDYTVSNLTSIDFQQASTYFLTVAYQKQNPAFGSGKIKIIGAGNVKPGDEVYIYINVDNVPIFIYAQASLGAQVPNVLASLSADAVSKGFTSTFIDLNTWTIEKPLSSISLIKIIINYAPYSQNKDSKFVYNWNSKYAFGLVYFDEKGKTNGTVISKSISVQTKNYEETSSVSPNLALIPQESLSINSRPPKWASYFQLVRSQNLTKSNFLYWISDRTYKDNAVDQIGYQYAYISIATLNQYILDNPSIKALGYEFSPGDRIRFVKLYSSGGVTSQIYSDKDFEIIDSLTNPTVNSVAIKGQVLKIVLPTTTPPTFDFGGDTYANYLIEIYTPALNFSNKENLYYEFGERYIIGNPGTDLAYHQGMTQNQTSNLSQPALFKLINGDNYFRSRLYSKGGSVKFGINTTNANIISGYYLGSTITSNTLNDPILQFQDSVSSNFFTVANYTVFKNDRTKSYNLNFKGSITVKSNANLLFSRLDIVVYDSIGISSVVTTISNFGPLIANAESIFTFDSSISFPINYDYIYVQISAFTGTVLKGDITITNANNTIYQEIIDPNFSDLYISNSTPNGRAWTYDPNSAQEFNPTLIRFGGEFQAGTTVNQTNRFYEENLDVYDRSRGSIKKMFIEGRNQYIFQQFDVGVVTVLTQIVKDTAGNPLSAQSERLLNKIVYPYVGGYGIGDMPESFAYGKSSKYFIDSNKGVVCRLAANGITPLSIVYKTNAFFVDKISTYKNDLPIPPLSGKPVIYGAFDAYTNKYMIAMEEIIDINEPLDPIQVQKPYTISFLETRDNKEGFETFFDYYPENMGALNNLFITYKDGQLWKHDSPTFCNFYNSQKSASVTVIFNDAPLDKKSFLSIMETANTVWYCSDIKSQLNSYGSTPQSTYIVAARFALLEGQYYSAILRDANSPGGIINGDTMHGNYIMVTFKIDSASSFAYLNTVSLNYNNSPLNLR